MAPSRGRKAAASTRNARRSRVAAKQSKKDSASDIYDDMIAEVEVAESEHQESDRPLKKRKTNGIAANHAPLDQLDHSSLHEYDLESAAKISGQQIIESSSDSESDYDFEDVQIDRSPDPNDNTADNTVDDIVDISVSVNGPSTPKKHGQPKRRPIKPEEKPFRLLVHKLHILCLLWHCIYINRWCNDLEVQRTLRPLLSEKTISYLNPSVNESQFQRNRSFVDGLEQASQLFRAHFKITASGLRRTRWKSDDDNTPLQETADPVDRKEFVAAAYELEGSQDTANQLFCALLRSAGVEARLLCSFQPLPFLNPPSRTTVPTPVKRTAFVVAIPSTHSDLDATLSDSAIRNSPTPGKISSVRRRLGQPNFAPEPGNVTKSKKKKRIQTLAYPVFWVEAFNKAYQKWVPVDPIVTLTVNKASKMEPPSSYEHNQMTYVIAFEASGVARDVTRRYAKAYNAKTRRQRVENSTGGTDWLEKALRPLRRRQIGQYRDQIEDAELTQREAREGLPSNVLDFKDHPYYALERHLKRHEVIHPKRKVGTVNAGTAAKPRMEPVYRRQDVLLCRSADKWYRLGRVVGLGEQAIKYVPSRQRQRQSVHEDNESEHDGNHSALYSEEQTELYVPEPVRRGRVPRNAYGNLDVYVPSMVPENGTHIRDPLAKTAAKILRVDHVDAVTGFQFKARRGTAVIEGVVVASEFADAVYATIDSLKDDQTEEASMARSAIALKMWRRFLTGLRIAERVKGHTQDGADVDMQEELNAAEDEQEVVAEAGGFLADDAADIAMPTAGRFSLDELHSAAKDAKRSKRKSRKDDTDTDADISMADESAAEPTSSAPRRHRRVVVGSSDDNDSVGEAAPKSEEGGGFLVEDNDSAVDAAVQSEDGDGFLPDNTETGVNEEHVSRSDEIPEPSNNEGGGFFVDENEDTERFPAEKAAAIFQAVPHDYGANENSEGVPAGGSIRMESENLLQSNGGGTDEEIRYTGEQAPSETYELQNDMMSETLRSDTYVGEPLPSEHANDIGTGQAFDVTTEDLDSAQDENREHRSDAGSMLSHDPDDEDAEPDWLESD